MGGESFVLGPLTSQFALQQTACGDRFAADGVQNTKLQESVKTHADWCPSKEGVGRFFVGLLFHVFSALFNAVDASVLGCCPSQAGAAARK